MPINFKNVYAGYRGNNTLQDITLSIEPGSIVGISGPNGSGKTTLLRVIQGLLPVSSGSAEVLGMSLDARNLKKIRLGIACVFQNLNTDPRMPVVAEEVVMMGRYGRLGLLRHPGEIDRRAVQDALERVDAVHLARRPFGQLSGGEQQRINLARALAQEPELLLLDEPTTFLDSDSQQRVRDIVRATHREMGITTLVVSHDFEMLSDLCERIVVMKAGRICEGVACV
ncbi:MAG: metal ABC transporter ATP-binding protein [Armatimonadota bacterium]|jgi:ABC-type cobalamin/Fe3+-siderophores transport system ATPase subunit